MEESNNSHASLQQPATVIPWHERLEDHNRKIDEYLRNCSFRGCSAETTIPGIKSSLNRNFGRGAIADPSHPDGRRPFVVQDLLDPKLGACRVGLIIESLMKDDLAPGTCWRYMSDVRYFCEYVVAKPNLPGTSEVTFADKYGPIFLHFTKFDMPVHVQNRPIRNRYALAPTLRDLFYEFLRTDYLPSQKVPHIAARDYTAVVVQTETGARVSELLAIQSGGERRDIDDTNAKVRLFGKAKPHSGKRIRRVPLTELAVEVLKVFEKVFKPMFPNGSKSEYLFLNSDGSRLRTRQFNKVFRKMIRMARNAGVPVPEDLRPHDLRRTFATNGLEQNPLDYMKILRWLGHSYPSSAAPYLIATDEDAEEDQAHLIDIFIHPNIIKRDIR